MKIIEIVKAYNTANGYDGLWNDSGECACLNGDLSPNDCMTEECQSGYREDCDCGEHDFHVCATPSTTKADK